MSKKIMTRKHLIKYKFNGLIWSPDRKFIFMKASRTAGSAMYTKIISKETNVSSAKRTQSIDWLNTITNKELKDYYIFTFVRNPFDRIVSLFYHRKIHGEFTDFVKNRLKQEMIIDEHFYPFSKFIETDTKQQYVNFIGRFETVDNDWKIVADKIGVSTKLPHYRVEGPKKGKPYNLYYNDETIKIVNELYNRDFEILKYERNI